MGFLKNIIRNAVDDGISKGIRDAVSSAAEKIIAPKAEEIAGKVAESLDNAAGEMSAATAESAKEAKSGFLSLEESLNKLSESAEKYATEAAKNMKLCPKCQTPASADKTFCPNCGAKLPDETVAEGALCPACGKQNTVGTKFCASCGAKLPFAIAEEKANAEKNAAVLARWAEAMPQYPVWSCGGTDYELEEGEDYFRFSASFASEDEGRKSIPAYRALLKANGFREAGEYPTELHLYKKIDGKCFHVDTEHSFDGSFDRPDVAFEMAEPTGGFDYVKPSAKEQNGFGMDDLKEGLDGLKEGLGGLKGLFKR